MSRARLLQDCFDDCGVVDLKIVGNIVCMVNLLLKKRWIDRAVVDVEWRFLFPEAFVEVLPCIYSNHNPLLLRCEGFPIHMGPMPFCFKTARVLHQDYAQLVSIAWHQGSLDVISCLILCRRTLYLSTMRFLGIFSGGRGC